MATQAKALNIHEAIEESKKKHAAALKDFKESGGLCLNCGLHKAEPNSMQCKDCNDEMEKLLQSLRGPGFTELRIK